MMMARNLTDSAQHNWMQNFGTLNSPHCAADAVAPIARSESSLRPSVGGGQEIDHLVDLADAIGDCKLGPVERHGFSLLPETRPFGSLSRSENSDNVLV